jgi:hypothetical protein
MRYRDRDEPLYKIRPHCTVMSSSISLSHINVKSPYESEHVAAEELKGLLSGSEDFDEQFETRSSHSDWSRNKIIGTASIFILLLICGTFARSFLLINSPTHPNLYFHGNDLRTNGTHDFKRTVLIVSIDGLR